jgi:predicted PurR-regulated permease PerM
MAETQSESPARQRPARLTTRSLIAAALLVLAVVAFAGLLWTLRSVLLLVFGSAIFAVLFRALAAVIESRTPLGSRGSLAVSMLIVAIVIVGGAALFGAQIAVQMAQLFETLPEAWSSFQQRIDGLPLVEAIRRQVEQAAEASGGTLVGQIATIATVTLTSVVNFVLVFFGAVYIAANPRMYRDGLVSLVPVDYRRGARALLGELSAGLRAWLIGQVLAMVIVGTLTGLVLSLLGVPSGLALGLMAGLAEFVPIVGPIAAAVPAMLISLSVSWELALYTAVAVVVIQQVESNLITPMIQRRMVSIPPALTLFAIVAFGLVFGPLGILFAAPLTVVVFITVRRLYIAEALGDDID